MDYVQNPGNHSIREGDTCVIYISEHQKYTLKIERGNSLQTKFGLLLAKDLIGHSYGLKYDCKKGWVLPLRLTPEIWTQILPHRTQILYHADISMILLQLDIKPGSIVLESGTGSGSLSHAIIRAIKSEGFLYTYDVSESRVEQARIEFEAHGLSKNVKVQLRNICELGFDPELEEKADACVLDLPQTWDAIGHAYRALKPDGSRLCAFSPCVEQVKQNVDKMNELQMRDIITIETLCKPYEVRERLLRMWNEDILDELSQIDKKRFENLKNLAPGQGCDNKVNTDPLIVPNDGEDHPKAFASSLERALKDPKAPFHSNMLPSCSDVHLKHQNESVSHSGFLTFATKRK